MSMQRGKKIPNEPRFNFVTETAYDFLLEYGYDRFPISPFKVLEDLSDQVVCLTWSEAKNILKSKDPFHLRETGAEARTIRRRDSGLYLIVYDDVNVNSADRISWTIMHEIGHIVLGHLVEFGETCLDRGGLTKKAYGTLEVEAHYFAAEFLMPTAILKYFSSITVDEISLLFGVSEEAAKKKYKRVFEATYLPQTSYDDKLIRNFYNFLDHDIDDAVYKSIYRQWGIPWKSKYVPICRKCPTCYSYILDPEAKFCYHCGSEIEVQRTYRNMFDRLSDRQKFTQIQGCSHPSLPSTDVGNKETGAIERVEYCPHCFNQDISDDALFCNICGMPLYNECSTEHTHLRLLDSFCPVCGSVSTFKDSYDQAEKRLNAISHCDISGLNSEDWIEYSHWGFTKMKLCSPRNRQCKDLPPALLYTKAFITDDEGLIVIADTDYAAAVIHKHKDTILEYAKRYDGIDYPYLEVYVVNDL